MFVCLLVLLLGFLFCVFLCALKNIKSWLINQDFSPSQMGRLRFELRTSRLKAGCSTAELATRHQARDLPGTRETLSLG